jgi:Methylamine utilisation protein MauE
MLDPVLHLGAVVVLVLVFGTAVAGKLPTLLEFEGVVGNYRLLPDWAVPLAARLVVLLEAAAVLLLVVPAMRGWGAGAALGLVVLFAAAMAVNIRRGRVEIDCGCFRTAHRQRLSWWLVGRNAALALAAAALWLPISRAPLTFDCVQAALGGAALFLIYLGGSQVVLPRPPSFDENFERSRHAAGLQES